MGLVIKIAAALGGLYALFLIAGSLYFYFVVLRRSRGQHLAKTPQTTDPFNWRGYEDLAQAGLDELGTRKREEVAITSFDGLKLCGHFYPVDGAQRTFLLVHGYRSTGYNDFNAQALFYMDQLHGNVLIIDQRAHGSSQGQRITFGVLERHDVRQWVDFLVEKLGSGQSLFINGISMGCASVLLAADLDLPACVRGIIADCGYTSPWDEFTYLIQRDVKMPVRPLLPMAQWLTRRLGDWDFCSITPKDALTRIRVPVLFIHGTGDRFVPAYMSEENHRVCIAEKRLLLVKGAQHAQSYFVDLEAVQGSIAQWVDAYSDKE